MTRFEARAILNDCDLLGTEDFFTLPASTVGTLIDHADRLKYRKPKNANICGVMECELGGMVATFKLDFVLQGVRLSKSSGNAN